MKTMAIISNSSSQAKRTARTSSANRSADSGPSASRCLAKSGTKAELNAPSAKSERKRLGKRKATTKACATRPVPTTLAIKMSRKKPKTRLMSVIEPTVAAERNSDMEHPQGPRLLKQRQEKCKPPVFRRRAAFGTVKTCPGDRREEGLARAVSRRAP